MENAEPNFERPQYMETGNRLLQSIKFGIAFNLDFTLLTSGSPNFDNETNKFIMLSVLRFIKDSGDLIKISLFAFLYL